MKKVNLLLIFIALVVSLSSVYNIIQYREWQYFNTQNYFLFLFLFAILAFFGFQTLAVTLGFLKCVPSQKHIFWSPGDSSYSSDSSDSSNSSESSDSSDGQKWRTEVTWEVTDSSDGGDSSDSSDSSEIIESIERSDSSDGQKWLTVVTVVTVVR